MKKITTIVTCALIAASSVTAIAQDKIIIDGSTTVGPIVKAYAEYFKEIHPNVNITISESGSGNGVKSLINKSCDIANLSRFMKDTEFKSSVENGVLPVAHVIAFDGLAIIVNRNNKVSSLTIAQAADIYTGKISNWKELGGDDESIVIVSRDTNSGTYESFNELVLMKKDISKNAEYVGSNGQARTRINTTKNAIGYVGLGFVDESVKAISINGILPTAKNVAKGKYEISRPLFMFTNGYPKMNSTIFEFINLCHSKEGIEIIKDLGFVPVSE